MDKVATLKLCRKCGSCKPLTEFRQMRLGSGFKYNRYSQCRTCCSAFAKTWRAKRKLRPLLVSEKQCRICLVTKLAAAFYSCPISKDGLDARCKSCVADVVKRQPNRTMNKRRVHLLRRYGLTLAEYDAMLSQQDGRCGICRRTTSNNLYVDHNHETGEVRGLLCHACNVKLISIEDRAFRSAAMKYLERFTVRASA